MERKQFILPMIGLFGIASLYHLVYEAHITSSTNSDKTIRVDVGYIAPFLRHFHSKMEAIDFDGYGCWCNGAHRGRPVDLLDSCCQSHYYCYIYQINKQGCVGRSLDYSYQLCPGDVQCEINEDACARHICQCDVNLSKCFVKNASAYNRSFDNFNSEFCTHYSN